MSGADLVEQLLLYRAYLMAKEQGMKDAMEVAKGVNYVYAFMLRSEGIAEMPMRNFAVKAGEETTKEISVVCKKIIHHILAV